MEDYVYGHSQTVKLQPNVPLAAALIEKAAAHSMYWYTDGDQQYQGLGLHKNQEICSQYALFLDSSAQLEPSLVKPLLELWSKELSGYEEKKY